MMRCMDNGFAGGRRICCAALAALTFAFGGCASFSGPRDEVVTPVQHPLIENLPLPTGFYIVPERSIARNMDGWRVAMCTFTGKLAPERVVAFYQNNMPSARFNLLQRRLENGTYQLRFASETEECTITVRRDGTQTVLVVDLGPIPRTPTGGASSRDRQLP